MIVNVEQALEIIRDFEDNPYGTPEEKKEHNKQANLAACGSAFIRKENNQKNSYSLHWNGDQKIIIITCKYYRECDGCREKKYLEEVEPRLNHAQNHMNLGDRPRFDFITEDQRGAYMKKLSRGGFQYYCFPQPSNELLVVHNNPDGEGDELWDFGYDDHDIYNEDNGLDLNFYTILKNVPEGKKISGSLGKKLDEESEEEGNGQKPEDEPETFPVKRPFIYKDGLSERDAHHAYKLALESTQNINVATVEDLERALFARCDVMASHIKDCVQGFTWDAVTQEDIESWNKNKNNFSNVQISTNKEYTSRNLDKRKPLVERIIDRATDDELKQEAIRDFLKQNYAN